MDAQLVKICMGLLNEDLVVSKMEFWLALDVTQARWVMFEVESIQKLLNQ